MSKQDNLTDFLQGVANAIRTAKGTSELIDPQNFESEISQLQPAPILISKTITQNGVYSAADDSADGYSSVDVQVSGGVDHGGKYLVRVIDYDGTVLKQDHLNLGAIFELPDAPNHNLNPNDKVYGRLTFQSWCTPVTITNNQITVPNSDITIGALYATISGKSEFDIHLDANDGLPDGGLTMTFTPGGTAGVEVDWGDGTITSDGSTTHTYISYGNYTIKCDLVTPDIKLSNYPFGNSSSFKPLYAAYGLYKVGSNCFFYCNYLETVSFLETGGLVDTSGGSAFGSCYCLKSVTVNGNLQSLGFSSCPALRSIAFSGTKISQLAQLPSLDSITLIKVTSLATDNVLSLSADYSLTKLTFNENLSTIRQMAFSDCKAILEYDFSNCVSIPTLNNSNAFGNINPRAKIIVPDSLYSEWITKTYWVDVAGYIVKASEA